MTRRTVGLAVLGGVPEGTWRVALTAVDRGLRLQHRAVQNASMAVASDRLRMRARAEVESTIGERPQKQSA